MNPFQNFQDSLTNGGFVHGAGTGWYAPDQVGYPHLHANLTAGPNPNLWVRVTFGGGMANQIMFDFTWGVAINFNPTWLPGNSQRRTDIIAAAGRIAQELRNRGY
jgi:hypothetical protein